MSSTFHRDVKAGVHQEKRILAKIQQKYPQSHRIEGYFKDWDIYIPELDIGIEVKSDKKSQDTGNLVIEIEFDNKPSALSTTKAEYWVIYDGINDVWIKPAKIKQCTLDNNLQPVRFVGKGDTKQKKAFLIKKTMLYPYADLIKKGDTN